MTLHELHAILQRAFDDLLRVRGNMPDAGVDTALAVGYALGTIGHAKALVGRDIDGTKATGEAPGPDARCSLCGKPADYRGPCGWGGCPLGADL